MGYVLTIGTGKEQNWDLGKRHELWALKKNFRIQENDELFFWMSKSGLIAHCRATSDMVKVATDEWLPWPDHAADPYKYKFGIEVIDERSSPVETRWSHFRELMGKDTRASNPISRIETDDRVRSFQILFDPSASEQEAPPLHELDVPEGLDQRDWQQQAIPTRRGQQRFRHALLDAYDGRCAISGCAVGAVLEAAHISPYRGAHTNDVRNGLLLRSDLHTLFDLHLLTVLPDGRVRTSPELAGSMYAELTGHSVLLRPGVDSNSPSPGLLEQHNANCNWLA